MAVTRVAGRNGLIYVSGNHIEGANAWELSVSQEALDAAYFGKTWMEREVGLIDWSGSVTALHDQDSKALYSAATQNTAAAVLIYPKRSDLTTYWSGSAIFSFSSSGDMGSVVGQSADFTAAGSLTATGFA